MSIILPNYSEMESYEVRKSEANMVYNKIKVLYETPASKNIFIAFAIACEHNVNVQNDAAKQHLNQLGFVNDQGKVFSKIRNIANCIILKDASQQWGYKIVNPMEIYINTARKDDDDSCCVLM